jgi:hypothetical protein
MIFKRLLNKHSHFFPELKEINSALAIGQASDRAQGDYNQNVEVRGPAAVNDFRPAGQLP